MMILTLVPLSCVACDNGGLRCQHFGSTAKSSLGLLWQTVADGYLRGTFHSCQGVSLLCSAVLELKIEIFRNV